MKTQLLRVNILIKLVICFFIIITVTITAFKLFSYYKEKAYLKKTVTGEYRSPDYSRSLLYRFHKPVIKSQTAYPLVLILHSLGGCGSDNKKQIDNMAKKYLSEDVQKQNPSFLLLPQCPLGFQWLNTNFKSTPFSHYNQAVIPESEEMQMIVRLINELLLKYPIDKSRIYVTGSSMGSSGAWDIISRHPEIFSAAIVVSGVSDTAVAYKLKDIPVWAFHGKLDDVAPARLNIEMQKAVSLAGGCCKLTLYDGIGHNSLETALKEPGLIDWLFKQKKISK